jgi:hypothetical protein
MRTQRNLPPSPIRANDVACNDPTASAEEVKTADHRQQNRERVWRWLEGGRVRALDKLVILRVCDFLNFRRFGRRNRFVCSIDFWQLRKNHKL